MSSNVVNDKAKGQETLYQSKNDKTGDNGYVKEILTEQDVYTSGIIYRYINNVDPNKDLITDTAKYGGPLKIIHGSATGGEISP